MNSAASGLRFDLSNRVAGSAVGAARERQAYDVRMYQWASGHGIDLDAAGHKVEIVPTRRGYRARCTCSYISATRRTLPFAVEAGVHHLQKVIREMRASGVSPAATLRKIS